MRSRPRSGAARQRLRARCTSPLRVDLPGTAEIVHLNNIATLRRASMSRSATATTASAQPSRSGAIALGACMIEKHFTLDKNMDGWDHAVSADPDELRAIVDGGRAICAALGSAVRSVNDSQLEKRKAFRRRMVAARALKAGERLGPDDVEFKRPGTGIASDEFRYAAGRALTRDVEQEAELEWSDFA